MNNRTMKSIKVMPWIVLLWVCFWIILPLAGQVREGQVRIGPFSVQGPENQSPEPAQKPVAWRERLREVIPLYGHRNWIVIADSAYPAQVSPGIEVIWTGVDHFELIQSVLSELRQAPHVQPIVYMDDELRRLNDTLAPGIEAYRNQAFELLRGYRISFVPHVDLIRRLDEVGRQFRILILKSDLTLPYTSVFLELDCKYWNQEKEQLLRKADLQPQRPER